MTEEELKKRLYRMLTVDILPFWAALRDDRNGGFYGTVRNDRTVVVTSSKGVILHARILWTFSEAYRLTGDTSYLALAEHAFRFIRDRSTDPVFGGLYWMTTDLGEPLLDFKHAYNQAFGIYASAAYYLAGHRQEALDYAMDLFQLLEKEWRVDNGYKEQLTRDFQPEVNEELSENGILAERTMNTVLHIMEAYTVLYEASGDAEVKEALRFTLDLLVKKMYNPQKERLEVFFDAQMNSLLDLSSYGHDIEASWLIDRALQTLGDTQLAKMTAPITETLYRHVMREAYTPNGVCFERQNHRIETRRDWWVQAEAVIGIYNDSEKQAAPSDHKEKIEELLSYIETRVKSPFGEWYWSTYEDFSHDEKRELAGPWKCPYHNSRMCMEILRRINEGTLTKKERGGFNV